MPTDVAGGPGPVVIYLYFVCMLTDGDALLVVIVCRLRVTYSCSDRLRRVAVVPLYVSISVVPRIALLPLQPSSIPPATKSLT